MDQLRRRLSDLAMCPHVRSRVERVRCILFAAAAAAGAACSGPDTRSVTDAPESPGEEHRAPVHVDSIFPIEEHLRRFRADLGAEPTALSGGAPSRQALVDRFVNALAAHDTAAFRDMVLTRAEFAWLYYPHTRYTAAPYRMAPELLWFQIENASSRGFGRLLDRLGGQHLDVVGHRCPAHARLEGPNRVWEECTLQVSKDGQTAELRLFGSILERGGVFKFVSYANDF
jgi:hypothetical protein